MLSKRFLGLAIAAASLLPAMQGCSSDNPLCCTEFKVGANIDASIGGSAQSQIAVQAVADLGGITASAIADLTTACRGIAQDLDADATAQAAADADSDANQKMKDWCSLAVKQIGSVKASVGGSLTINAKPPQCSVSISAQAQCQGKCDVSGKCDIKANPPTCKGGDLQVDCQGGCTAKAGASLSCTGSCTGNCTGSCTAQGGGVACAGKCDGSCSVATDSKGACNGTCTGTCSVTAPSASCSGTCSGTCSATCQGSATASVKCDGTCDANYTPVSCTGGTLQGGCQVDAHCQANCNASAQAKAECTPPSIDVELSVQSDLGGKLIDTLKANFPAVLAIVGKFSTFGDITANFVGNIGAVTDIKVACIPLVAAAAGQVVSDSLDVISVSGSLTGSVGGS